MVTVECTCVVALSSRIMVISAAQLIELGCPGSGNQLAALVRWLQEQEVDHLTELRGVRDLSRLNGVHIACGPMAVRREVVDCACAGACHLHVEGLKFLQGISDGARSAAVRARSRSPKGAASQACRCNVNATVTETAGTFLVLCRMLMSRWGALKTH